VVASVVVTTPIADCRLQIANLLLNEESLRDAFVRADRLLERGQLRQAFVMFRGLAKRGYSPSLLNLGYFYDVGLGTRKNRGKALYWYRRAWRDGDASGAHNIGTIHRDRRDRAKALAWFSRAARAGNDSSRLEIAKIYIDRGTHRHQAAQHLRTVVKSNRVCESDAEEAATLLKQLRASPSRSRR